VTTEVDAWASQLRKGVLELAVLGLLEGEPRYGSQLVDDLSAHPDLAVTAGTVYPLLARLARSGLVSRRSARRASTTS
jgi:PadR family transcriptional regulator PadR